MVSTMAYTIENWRQATQGLAFSIYLLEEIKKPATCFLPGTLPKDNLPSERSDSGSDLQKVARRINK